MFPVPPRPAPPAPEPSEAPSLPARMGAAVAEALEPALARVQALTSSGRIDRTGLRRLRAELELARLAAIAGQQLARLTQAAWRAAPSRPGLDAARPAQAAMLLGRALCRRAPLIDALDQSLALRLAADDLPVPDADSASELLLAALDAVLVLQGPRLELELDNEAWPPRARLVLRAPGSELDAAQRSLQASSADLLARRLGWTLRWEHGSAGCELLLEWPLPARPGLPPGATTRHASAPVLSLADAGAGPAPRGAVWVLGRRVEASAAAVAALDQAGCQALVADAPESLPDGDDRPLPLALLVDDTVADEALAPLLQRLRREQPRLPLLRAAPRGHAIDIARASAGGGGRVGLAALRARLPLLLAFELARIT